MTTLEKLLFCKSHGISISYIANRAKLVPATLTKWMRGEKGITRKNEEIVNITLLQIVKELSDNIGDNQ